MTPGVILVIRGAHAEAVNKIIAGKTADSQQSNFVPTFSFPLAKITSVSHKRANIQ